MKKEQGITLVALVVSIMILIILAGISLNATIGENGIITKAKQAKQNITLAGEAEALQLNQLYYELETGGELTEDEESSKKNEIISLLQKQVEELQKQIANLQTENIELKKQIETLTSQIASLQKELQELKVQIAEKDIEIAELKKQLNQKEAKIQEIQNQLNNLNSLLSQTNSTADKILAGYKAYSGGKLLTGTMVNQGAVSSTLNCGQSYMIPAGYHNGSGKIAANSLASQTSATATADNISEGKTAWVNGQKITGNGKDVNNAGNSAKWQLVSQYTSVVQTTSEITISPVMVNEHFSTVSSGKMTIMKSGNYKFSMIGTTYNIATTLTIKIYINNSLTKTFSSKEWISNGTRGTYTDLSLKEGDIVEIKGGVSNLSDGGGLFSGILFFE